MWTNVCGANPCLHWQLMIKEYFSTGSSWLKSVQNNLSKHQDHSIQIPATLAIHCFLLLCMVLPCSKLSHFLCCHQTPFGIAKMDMHLCFRHFYIGKDLNALLHQIHFSSATMPGAQTTVHTLLLTFQNPHPFLFICNMLHSKSTVQLCSPCEKIHVQVLVPFFKKLPY